jgi:hypothetical protein
MVMLLEKIKQTAKEKFGSFRQYAISIGKNETTFTRTIESNLNKLNEWIEPLGLEIHIVLKKQRRDGKIKRT